MKEATEYQVGKTIDYTLAKNVKVGEVVPLGEMVGIAVVAGATGEVIALEIEKVWTINAKNSDVITIGDTLYWDDTNNVLTKTSTNNTKAGKAISSKGATAGTINIKINI